MALASTSSATPPSASSSRQPQAHGNADDNGETPGDPAQLKMIAFRRLKPACVALMSLGHTPLTATSRHAPLLADLLSLCRSLPPAAFTPNLINYVLFPLTQILRSSNPSDLPEVFLEAAFRLLAFLVEAWKATPGGMDTMAWEQLWRFTVASVSVSSLLRSDPGKKGRGKGKGKERALDQEVHLQAIHLLASLLQPSYDLSSSDILFPSATMRSGFATSSSPLMSTLFQTLTYLVAHVSPAPPHLALQLAALRLLRPLISFLRGQHPVLAALLPGTVSGVAKLVAKEGRWIKGDVAAEAAGLVGDVVALTLSDEDLRKLGVLGGKVDDLSQLAEEFRGDSDDTATSSIHRSSSPTPSTTSATGTASRAEPFPPLTASYLAFTSSQLLSAVPPILLTLSDHPSHQARIAAAGLAASIITHCRETLSLVVPSALRVLLYLSQDDFDPVRHDARRRLRGIVGLDITEGMLLDLLSAAIQGLPRSITSGQEDEVERGVKLVMAISDIVQIASDEQPGYRNPIADLLGPEGKIERWSWALLDCLEFGQPPGWSATNNAARSATLGWSQSLGTNLLLPSAGAGGERSHADIATPTSFPDLPLRYTESLRTIKVLGGMCQSLGRAGGEKALHAVEYLLLFARNERSARPGRAASALWLAEKVLGGIVDAQLEGPEGRVGRKVRKMAKEVVRVVLTIDADDVDDDADDEPVHPRQDESEAVVPIERSKGVNAITTLLDRPVPLNGYAADETRRLRKEAHRTLLICRCLALLAEAARILSSAFRPLLLNTLYSNLAHLASPHVIVRDHAEIALALIAFHTGYATPQNLVLDNVDYVINVVSQRLTPSRLSVQAPLVLIAMIRLVGAEIVPLVHDVVEEIFDALDNYHGYEILTSGLLAVLVTLMQVMAADTAAEGMSEERRRKVEEFRRIAKPPDPKADFEEFGKWYRNRQEEKGRRAEEVLQSAPDRPWTKLPDQIPQAGEEEEDGGGDAKMDDPDSTPLTRSQEVTKQILEKCINFLSHSNPFLRSRILSLLTSAVSILAAGNREGDLLPLIDRAWGVIMTRLSDSEGYVVTAAAEVIAALSEHVGDFMSRRILDHAWPKFKSLLKSQQDKDQYSAMTRRGARPPGVGGGTGSFTESARLHTAILRAMRWVVEEVPVDDQVLWDAMVTFRPFLDRRADAELRHEAKKVYHLLGRRDGDALYVVLCATKGRLYEGQSQGAVATWGYLGEPGLDIDEAAAEILGEISI